jgi:hypothetical protein
MTDDTFRVRVEDIQLFERNVHHYVRGMEGLPQAEQAEFLRAHGDLYRDFKGVTSLNIEGGRLSIASLGCPGFASAAMPRWQDMRAMS